MNAESTLPAEQMAASAAYLPPTMSMPLGKAIEEYNARDYRNTLIHVLDFFEMGVQWLNCLFLATGAILPDARSDKGMLRAVAMIDNKRPLSFGDSVNELFNPLLEAMQRLMPDHPLVVSLGTHVKTRRRNILVGSQKEPGVIKIRNDYKGHSTALAQDIYRQALERLAPALYSMLSGLEPLAHASIRAVKSTGEVVRLGAACAPEATGQMTPAHYYVEFDRLSAVDLYPLVTLVDDRYVYVFQTLKYEEAKYESSDENVRGFETDRFNQAIDSLLQHINPQFDIARELNWHELQECMRRQAVEYMIQVQKEKKYSSELFVDRQQLTAMLDDFASCTATLIPMSGEAGQGKTNQLCHWTETFLADSTPVMIFSCSSFAERSLPDTLRSIFGLSPRRPVSKLLDLLHSRAAETGRKVFFMFDAVNECLDYPSDDGDAGDASAPRRLFDDIVSTLVRDEYPMFKVVSTCRSYTWKNEIMPGLTLPERLTYRPAGADTADVHGFNDAETREAYVRYQELYQMETGFDQLDRRVVLRLRDPLVMKYTCSNFIGRELPSDPGEYVSVRLFGRMLDDIDRRSFAGHRQMQLLMELSRIIMQSYLDGTPISSVTNTALREASAIPGHPLHALARQVYKSDGVTASYAELRSKPDRPILREVEKSVEGHQVRIVEFIYERFLEYMMARAMTDTLAREGRRPDAAAVAGAMARGAVNVVFVGAMRNVVILELLRDPSSDLLRNLVTGHRDSPNVMLLVNEVMDTMVRENIEPELFAQLGAMLSQRAADAGLTAEYNERQREIASNRATAPTIVRYNELSAALQPVMRLRACANTTLSNMMLTDLFNEDLYRTSPLQLLWQLVTDPIDEVGNEACKFVYYLSRRHATLGHSPLRENLTIRIVREMYADLRSRSIAANLRDAAARRRAVAFAESGTRLATLMIIDSTISEHQDTGVVTEMLNQMQGIASYFTWRFRLVKAVMPFLQTIMRRQLTFQSIYVNNIIEYQGFWNDSIVPPTAPEGIWSREQLRRAMSFVGFYTRHHADRNSQACRDEQERFRDFLPVVESGYMSGCSFTYFILERILIIVGTDNWEAVRDLFFRLLSDHNRGFEWFDYMQMSIIYDLFHLQVNSSSHNSELMELLTRQVDDWTRRRRGLFAARHSHKANPTGLYKRNVINWYCVAYCAHSGDNVAHSGDLRPVPLLYELIDSAVASVDKELLIHLLDNIAELVSDFGLVHTALDAIRHILKLYSTPEDVARLDNAPCPRDEYARTTLTARVGSVLSTAKTYYPEQTDAFIRSDITGLNFPGIESFREDILNYHPRGESLSDIFTHKFGNFLLWSLMHEEVVDRFAEEAVGTAVVSRDCFAWFDTVIRILFRDMFKVKI